MFSVTPLNVDVENLKYITSGINFGYIKKKEHHPLKFNVKLEGYEAPLTINFLIKEDKNYSNLEFKMGKIKENNLNIFYYNPPQYGSFGLSAPTSLIQLNTGELLGAMFWIDLIGEKNKFDVQYYRLSYEFYSGKIEKGVK